ncbi:MAG TPA: hypothetical protein DIS76_03105, partial [Rhodospirillaceae bacterium]|nr:hypothetical protein [Rhodospirillaceae bacterium]
MAMRIGDYLVMKGMVTATAVEAAAMESQITSERIGTVLVRNGFLRQEDLIDAILHLEPDRIRVEKVYNTPVPRQILAENKIVIVAETGDEIFVSTLNTEAQARAILQHYYPGKKLRFVPIGARDLDEFQEALAQAQGE